MQTVSVSGLKNNPSEALRKARKELVVVMSRDRPAALMVGIEASGVLDAAGVRPALVTASFSDGQLSLVRAARLAQMPVGRFVDHVSRLGIAVIRLDAQETSRDVGTLEQWLASS